MDEYSVSEYNRNIRLLTAHHLDDNIETLLMNFFKGTGIAGLRGMLPSTEKVKRPFLFAKRLEIEQYAASVGLNWVEDSSNLEDKYSRNFFRHQVIPLVEKIFPQAIENLSDNLGRFRDIEKIYLLSVEQMVKKLVIPRGKELHIPVEKLRLSIAARTLVYEIISRYGFHANHVEEVMKLLDSQTGKYVSSATHRIIKNRNWLIIALNQTSSSGIFLLEEIPSSLIFQGGKINLSITHPSEVEVLYSGNGVAYLNAVDIRFPLILRKWKTGDYFYPLGMRKKKKISRFLIDLKKSKIDKENTWVLESDKRIVWVVGERLDDRFKWTPAAKIVFRIVLENSSNS
jgi:tRNA(Ile)-lysidine synthase